MAVPAGAEARAPDQRRRATESFAGTDFSYEDLSIMAEVLDWGEDKAPPRVAGKETIDGHASDIIELTPTAGRRCRATARFASGSGATIRWCASTSLRRSRTASSQDAGALGRRAKSAAFPPRTVEMRNERTGSHTTVDADRADVQHRLDDEVFTQRRLEKGAS